MSDPYHRTEALELYHHAVILLSTHSQGLQGRSRSRATQIRQSQALHSVAALIRRHRHPHPTPPLALSAYTIALAFSVTYSHLKEARSPSARALALEHVDLFHPAARAGAGFPSCDGGGGEAVVARSSEYQALAPSEFHHDGNPDEATLLPSRFTGNLQGEGLEGQTSKIASLLEGCSALSSSEYGAYFDSFLENFSDSGFPLPGFFLGEPAVC
ncbi:hypothetical protein BO82DRAFT_397879 [Aspergillus uvarum CBS 121591]|uniref:Transcription factor domain-containing protein n=1 Tax=Aspergillus uvarum CBS 121591 TaxID=1448315 RepID=A0A319E4W0_9EURO|nr:hypothetical protein BO82DRAFT_397879 [Aspergillus uvarum CBS 121591]PYH86132.1 hypothetical protein BO82DRAFT_397879 [Aspergillus uvarum CBS 121591]